MTKEGCVRDGVHSTEQVIQTVPLPLALKIKLVFSKEWQFHCELYDTYNIYLWVSF